MRSNSWRITHAHDASGRVRKKKEKRKKGRVSSQEKKKEDFLIGDLFGLFFHELRFVGSGQGFQANDYDVIGKSLTRVWGAVDVLHSPHLHSPTLTSPALHPPVHYWYANDPGDAKIGHGSSSTAHYSVY